MSEPFADVQETEGGFSIPALKWRELVFVGALKPDGDGFVRDSSRPLPPFLIPDLFPEGTRFCVRLQGERVHVARDASGAPTRKTVG